MSLEIGKTALLANQLSLDIVGKNIAHANDPNYARQRVRVLDSVNGYVDTRIQHAVNISLENDNIRETAILTSLEVRDEVLAQIESSINELSDSDISSALDTFYNDLEQLSLNPHDDALRQNTVESASKVTDIFHLVSTSFINSYENLDQQIHDSSDKINSLLESIAENNIEITRREGGPEDNPAVSLRKTRRENLAELASYMDITVRELSNGSVFVSSAGRTLVFQGEMRGIYVDRSSGKSVLKFTSDNDFVSPKNGKLAGYMTGRDSYLKTRMDELDEIASNFAWQINKVHNTGRGKAGISKMVSETKMDLNFIDDALDIAEVNSFSLGSKNKPKNGIMTLQVRNDVTGQVTEKDVKVNLIGSNKTTLESLRDDINQVGNLTASIDNVGRITLESDAGYSFFIKEDTSDVSSFLGLNNFFSGNSASSINVDSDIQENVQLMATGKSPDSGDNINITNMINTKTTVLSSGLTLNQTYEKYVSSIASQANRISSLMQNQTRILNDVVERRQAYSGVNLDEEAASLLKYQQSYQAAARYMSIQSELTELLMQII